MTPGRFLVAVITLLVLITGSLSSSGTPCNNKVSKKLRALASTMTGRYTNEEQLREQSPGTDFAVYEAVNIPGLLGDVAMYCKVFSDAGLVYREEVWAFAEDPAGYIEGRVYSVISDGKEPGELAKNDLQLQEEECKMFFKQTDNDTFVGTRPECGHVQQEGLDLNLFYPLYTLVFSRSGITVVASRPQPLKDETTRTPTRMILTNERPPLPQFLTCQA